MILIYSFFTFKSHQQSKKSVQKEKLQSRKLHVCAQQITFSAILLLNKIKASKQDACLTLLSMEVLNKDVRSKLVSRVFLLFDINIKERESPGNEVA